MVNLKNERGATLVFTILLVVVLLLYGSIFVMRTTNEWFTASRERRLAQAFYIAEAGADAGLAKLDNLINTHMLNTVNATNPQTVSNRASKHAGDGDALGFLILAVKDGGVSQFVQSGAQAIYSGSPVNLGQGSYVFNIVVIQKGSPITVSVDVWDFPYDYLIHATGTVFGNQRRVTLAGDFTVRVQRDNFAKFALFTDHHGMPSGATVWFTDKTNFAGPIHTNEKYSFAFSPSGIFDGIVTQQHKNAQFYNNGWVFQADADSNPGIDVPIFNASYNRGVDQIVLASSVQKKDLYDQARGGEVTTGNGIFVVNDGVKLKGGIYVNGNATIQMGLDASNNAKYTITQGATTKIITVDIANKQTSIETLGSGTSTYAGLPEGIDELGTIIYVDGSVTSLKGTVQQDTEITISCENDIIITDHIRYSDYNPAIGSPGDPAYVPPNAAGKKNLMGLIAWGGNVRIGPSAPNNIDIHSIIMARNGIFTVDGYDNTSAGPRGNATLLGGAITQFYGAFGLFSGATGAQLAGYGRNFVYDSRTLLGKSPPYFPSMRTFIAFTNDITDKIAFQEGGF